MKFEFATAGRILFGPGTLSEVAPLARELGRRTLVVTGQDPSRAEPLVASLRAKRIGCVPFAVAGEPTTDQVRRGVERARASKCDLVISFGGGSPMDAGKAIAALMTNPGEPLDYLEVIGEGRPLLRPAVAMIAIPTTAGTGAEVTRNAVLGAPEHRVKVSLRSPFLLPRLAVVDPLLTQALPPHLTASTGLDALTQLIEPFVSSRANPLTDSLCREGLARVARSLRRAVECGEDANAREDMALASLLGGLALANAGLGAVHGFAGPLGGMFHAPHGAVCGALLPHVLSVNVRALTARAPDHPALGRYAEVGRILSGRAKADGTAAIHWVEAITQAFRIPPLSRYGVVRADFPTLIAKASVASSMKGNPISLTIDEMNEILTRGLGTGPQ